MVPSWATPEPLLETSEGETSGPEAESHGEGVIMKPHGCAPTGYVKPTAVPPRVAHLWGGRA